MQLYAVDQVSISSVRAESLRPGESFTVSSALGEELLRKLPNAVSPNAPKLKEPPVSVQAVFDKLGSDLLAAQADADNRLTAIAAFVTAAQADADAQLVSIAAAIVAAQADADAKISEIAASIGSAQADAAYKIIDINASIAAAQTSADAEIKKIDDAVASKKAEPAPLNKSEAPPKNK